MQQCLPTPRTPHPKRLSMPGNGGGLGEKSGVSFFCRPGIALAPICISAPAPTHRHKVPWQVGIPYSVSDSVDGRDYE